MTRINLLLSFCFILSNSFCQSYECPEGSIGGLPADNIYSPLASFSSNSFVAAQAFVNFDSINFEAVSIIGLRHNGDWEFCMDQSTPTFKVDFWTYEDLLPGELIESIDDAYLTIDSLDTWNFEDKDWVLERFTFTFNEPRNHILGFISIYNEDEAPNNTCKFNWLYNYPDNINLEGATIHDDGSTVIWNAFNFCLLSEGIAMSTKNIENKIQVNFFPNPLQDYLNFDNRQGFNQIELYDALGVLQFSKKLTNSNPMEKVNIQSLPKGTYFVRLTNQNEQTTISTILIK